MTISELSQDIKKGNVKSCYLFYGKEHFLINQKIALIKKTFVSNDFADFNYSAFDSENLDIKSLEDSIMSVPLMSEKNVVVLKNVGLFKGGSVATFVENICANIPKSTCLIIFENEIDKRKKVFTKINEVAGVINFEYLDEVTLKKWAENLLERSGKRMITRDLNYLLQNLDGSMATVYAEISKLIAYCCDRDVITIDDIKRVVSFSIEIKIFEMLDNIILQKFDKVLYTVREMRLSGDGAVEILGRIASNIGEILMVMQLSKSDRSGSLAKQFFEPNRQFLIRKMQAQAKNFSEDYLKKMLVLGQQYDAYIKSGKLNEWVALDLYISELAGTA